MKKNKYIVFITIGLELIGLIIVSLWLGQYLSKNGYGGSAIEAICVLTAFIIWFISLVVKLKGLKND